MSSDQWLDTWVSTPQPTRPDQLPPAPLTRDGRLVADLTVRQTVRASLGGNRLRLCFSNAFGDHDLALGAVSVGEPSEGRAGVGTLTPGSSQPVTFAGQRSIVVPAGERRESDLVEYLLAAGANLAVTTHLAAGQPDCLVTSHPGSRTTSYLAAGYQAAQPELPGVTSIDHWYFLCGVRIPRAADSAVVVAVGDSLTDGRGSTTNGNDRWPDQLFDRLRSHSTGADLAVLNHGVGASRLLDDGLGPGALDRLIAAVLARTGVRWLIVLKGVNDLGTAAATAAAQRRVASELTTAYDQIVTEVGRRGVRVYGATIPPFGGNEYDDPGRRRDAARQRVNDWIRTSGRFDGVIDADAALRDPEQLRRLAPRFDVGDHLHLNPAGYAALAAAVPDGFFTTTPPVRHAAPAQQHLAGPPAALIF